MNSKALVQFTAGVFLFAVSGGIGYASAGAATETLAVVTIKFSAACTVGVEVDSVLDVLGFVGPTTPFSPDTDSDPDTPANVRAHAVAEAVTITRPTNRPNNNNGRLPHTSVARVTHSKPNTPSRLVAYTPGGYQV